MNSTGRILMVTAVIGSTLNASKAAERTPVKPLTTALKRFVAEPEPQFSWKLQQRIPLETGTVYDIALTSQQWQGITWKHALFIYEPKQLKHTKQMLLFVTGGSNGNKPWRSRMALGMSLLLYAYGKGNAGIAATLSSMSPVLVLPIIWMITRQMPSGGAWTGALVCVAGSALLFL